MFKKLVAIEPVSLIPTAEEALHQYAEQVELYRDIPADDEEIVRRIGDADAALLSYTSRMQKRHRALPEPALHRDVLQPLLGGKRQCGHRLCPGKGIKVLASGTTRPRRCGVRPA